MRQVLRAGALGRSRVIRWRGRWEGGSGWRIHVNPWLIHVKVWQKPLQYCKVISLQLIKINGKKYALVQTFYSVQLDGSRCYWNVFLSWNKIIALSNNFPSATTRKLILSKKLLRRGIIIFVLFQVFVLFLNSDLFLNFCVKTVIRYMSQVPEQLVFIIIYFKI